VRYDEAVAFLNGLVDYEKLAKPRDGFKLDDIRGLLGFAGNPQQRLRRVVLVAGTKGKGSVCYMIEAALRGCGLRTGMFVSPHVSTVRERIQLDGIPISSRRFASLVERYRPLVWRQPVSYFELTAALAFSAFARARVDCAVVEVGLGGRLDATNLVEPDVSVITRIGYDHTRVLGGSLRRIAAEKAGIMRSGRVTVSGQQQPVVRAELAVQAGLHGATLVRAADVVQVRDAVTRPGGVGFAVRGGPGAGRVDLPLLGRHQVENCRIALAVLGLLVATDRRIRFRGVCAGLRKVVVPARCEVVQSSPVLIVDSAHNPDSGAALARVIATHVRRKVVLVYGSLKGKLITPTVRPLAPWVRTAVLVRPDSPRAADFPRLRRVFGRLGIPYVVAGSVRTGLERARELAGSRGPVVVTGSFYVAGEALQILSPGRGD
jgi:dihydrofolate synthase/folylpolyglutamate synthase